MGGVEPPDAGVKVLCLTSWRHRFMGKLSVLLNNSFAARCRRMGIRLRLGRLDVDVTKWDCQDLSPSPCLLTCFALIILLDDWLRLVLFTSSRIEDLALVSRRLPRRKSLFFQFLVVCNTHDLPDISERIQPRVYFITYLYDY